MNEHEDWLRAMLDDDGGTWDLSPKDKAAIRWALNRMDVMVQALTPFVRVASGIPGNWPGHCVLTFEVTPGDSGHHRINSLPEHDDPGGPTISQYRFLERAAGLEASEPTP